MMLTPARKVAIAKRLLIEATRELRAGQHAERDALKCGCRHRRDRHTVAYSINYTAGFCMEPGCTCRHFMMLEGPR